MACSRRPIYLTNMSQYAYVSLSLIGLCALAGAGVGVGSGVAMMYSQMAQAEQEQKTSGAVAHSPGICSCFIFTLQYLPLIASNCVCVRQIVEVDFGHGFAVESKNVAASRGFAAAGAKSQ